MALLTIATRTGASSDAGTPAKATTLDMRFSGGGEELLLRSRITVPDGGDGISGVTTTLPLDHALWKMIDRNDAIAAGLPGHVPTLVPLTSGHSAIREFLDTCGQPPVSAQTAHAPEGADEQAGGHDSVQTAETVQDAFEFAQSLNTITAWQAFLKVYPAGFYGELARTHLRQLQDQQDGDPQDQDARDEERQDKSSLPHDEKSAEAEPWYQTTQPLVGGLPAKPMAAVRRDGLELMAWCAAPRDVALAVRETSPGSNPEFEERAMMAVDPDGPNGGSVSFSFGHGGDISVPMTFTGAGGELSSSEPLASGSDLLRNLASSRQVRLVAGPLEATFQLDGSREALCSALASCGGETLCDSAAATGTLDGTSPAARRKATRHGAHPKARPHRRATRGRVHQQYDSLASSGRIQYSCTHTRQVCRRGASNICNLPCF